MLSTWIPFHFLQCCMYAHSTTPILLSFLFGRTPFYILEKKCELVCILDWVGMLCTYVHKRTIFFSNAKLFFDFHGESCHNTFFTRHVFFFFGIVLYIELLHPTSYYHQTSFFVFGMSFFSVKQQHNPFWNWICNAGNLYNLLSRSHWWWR